MNTQRVILTRAFASKTKMKTKSAMTKRFKVKKGDKKVLWHPHHFAGKASVRLLCALC